MAFGHEAGDDERAVAAGFVVTPETVASRTFTTSFRGFDQAEVRAFLRRVSEELGGAAEREAQLRRLLQDAQNKAAHPEVDEALLTNALGEHAARLLASAREQAGSIRSEAESKAARLMREAEAQIGRIRAEADSLLARRVEEVDGVTANLRNAAEADARALREQAKADVEAELQNARSQGREMVAEARAVRERVLADLARRRHIAEVQLEQLRAARERLLTAYALVRRTLDEATQELKMAEVEARLAAEEVARRAPEPPPPPPPRDDGGSRHFDSGPIPVYLPPRGPATAVRDPRAEPATRSETRLRPPGRPEEPTPPPPNRRPTDAEAPGRAEPLLPAEARAPGAEHFQGGGPSRPPSPPHVAPPRMAAPPRPGSPRPEPTQPGPHPPSIVPRPVSPPPPRRNGGPSVASPPAPGPAHRTSGEDASWPPVESDQVNALFARIKADRAATAAGSAPPSPSATPVPPAPPAPERPSAVTPVATGGGFDAEAAPPPAPTRSGRSHIADENARGRRDELLDPIEEALARHLKRVLQDEQNEVLDKLRRRRRRQNGSPLPSLDEQVGRYREAAESVLADAVRAGVRFADPSASEAHADEAAARDVADALAREVAEPLRVRLDHTLQEANGDRDGPEAAELVSAVYRQWRTQELERLARHHATTAFSRGAYAAYPEAAGLRWVVDDESPCPDCEDNDLAGTVLKGQAYPTGQLFPPAHPGCHCLLVPAV